LLSGAFEIEAISQTKKIYDVTAVCLARETVKAARIQIDCKGGF
jgi:hypothetical protein